MEIIEKFNLKTKALVIILITILLACVSTMSFATEEKEVIEPKLNSKVYFEGETYKLPNKDKVRKEYAEGEMGCGIISIISKNAKHPVYVTGEGWIDVDQIVSLEKYITINFERGEGLTSHLTVNGEFMDIQSTNTAVLDYKDGMLNINGNGNTEVVITTKEGKEIEALATVVNGGLVLSVPDKAVAGELSVTAEIADKVTVEANGNAGAALEIGANGIDVVGEGNGNVVVKAEDKEILSADGNVTGALSANKDGITANVEAEQNMNLLQRLTLKLKERANLAVNKEEAMIGAGGDIAVNEKELASGDATLTTDYVNNPDLNVNGHINGQEFDKVIEIPVKETIQRLRDLIARMRAM